MTLFLLKAFTLQGDQVYSFPTFRYYSSNQDKAKFLTSNVEEDIASFTAEINALKQRIAQANQQKIHLEAEIKQNVATERRTETQLMKIRDTKRRYSMVIRLSL